MRMVTKGIGGRNSIQAIICAPALAAQKMSTP